MLVGGQSRTFNRGSLSTGSIMLGMVLCLSLLKPPASWTQEHTLTVVVREGQLLRDIAETYLGDPNLWQEILRVNGLHSPNDVQPGVKLRIPRNEITLAHTALQSALRMIQKATKEGARVFAKQGLDEAIQLRQAALVKRRQSDWQGCFTLAKQAETSARQALRDTLERRKGAAQAILTDRVGTVQGRKTVDLLWSDLDQGTILVEKEKVRTLSRSSGEVQFVDESRIRLGQNSQMVIQSLRVDRLNQRNQSNVTLMGGDVYALLGSAGKGKGFHLKVPGITLEADSVNFWVAREKSRTLVANYDEDTLKVTAKNVTVTVGKNQGTVVEKAKEPTRARGLLAAPRLRSPDPEGVRFGGDVVLTWQVVPKAVMYRLEVATDIAFARLAAIRPQLRTPKVHLKTLADGAYYWRVSAIDRLGFPGPKSLVRRFWIVRDVTAPHLIIITPQDGEISRMSVVHITGLAEPQGVLTVNGKPITIADDGTFQHDYALVKGKNGLVFQVTDRAGNTTKRERSIVFMPDQHADIVYDAHLITQGPKQFVTRSKSFILSGQTAPNAKVDVDGASGALRAAAYTDTTGRFRLKLPIFKDEQAFVLSVRVPSGFVTEDRFTVIRDTQPPEIRLQSPPPSVVSTARLRLTGQVIEGERLTFNGQRVPVTNGTFDTTVVLREGPNRLELVAVDAVANEVRWQKTVFVDREPPRLVAANVSHRRAKGGDVIEIRVRADDATGMKRHAKAILKVGAFSQEIRLTLDKATSMYQGVARLPQRTKGRVVLGAITLQDYIGNMKTYAAR